MQKQSLNDILASVVNEKDLNNFVTFTSDYLKLGIRSSEAMRKRFVAANQTPEALNELSCAASYLKRMQQKLSIAGVVLRITLDYDYMLRIVFKINAIYNINDVKANFMSQYTWRRTVMDSEEAMFLQFGFNLPRITYSSQFVSVMSKKYLAGSLDEYKLYLEYSPFNALLYQFDFFRDTASNYCKEAYMKNPALLGMDKYKKALPYAKLTEMFNIYCNSLLRELQTRANNDYEFDIDMDRLIDSRTDSMYSRRGDSGVDMIRRYERDESKDMLTLFGRTLTIKAIIKELIVNRDLLKCLANMTDPVQVEVIMNHSIALVVRALNKYVYDLTTYLQIGVVQNKDIYCIPKQKLADSLIKAFQLLDDKPLLLINVLPVTYTSSTKATYDDTYEWVKAGRQTEYSAPRRANNKFLVGNDMYSLQVEAYMSTYLCLKERLDRVADGGIF